MEEKEGSIKIEEVKIKRSFKNLKAYQKVILYFIGIVLLFMLGVLISYLTSLDDSKTPEISIDYELKEEEQVETVTITSNVKMTSIEVQEEIIDEEDTADETNEISIENVLNDESEANETTDEETEETEIQYEYVLDSTFTLSEDLLTYTKDFTENVYNNYRITFETGDTEEFIIEITDLEEQSDELTSEDETTDETQIQDEETQDDDDEEQDEEENTNTNTSNTTSSSSNSTSNSSSSNSSNKSSSSSNTSSSSSSTSSKSSTTNSSSSNSSNNSSSSSSSSSKKSSSSNSSSSSSSNSSGSSSSSSSSSSSATYSSYSSKAKEALQYINEIREENGVGDVSWSSTLASIAETRAYEITTDYSHTSASNALSSLSSYAENIGYDTSAKAMIYTWAEGSGHLQNMILAKWNQVGVGCVGTGSGDYYWVAIFTR